MPPLRVHFDRFLDARAPKVALDISFQDRLALFHQYGDFSLAYSTIAQSGLSYFGDVDGYIAFGTKMGHHFALGDPVADVADHANYIRRFVEAGNNPWFVQISEKTAQVLSGLGYKVNRLGIDTRFDVPEHEFSGKHNETVRYSERWLLKNGYSFAEDNGQIIPHDEVERLSTNWRAGRIVHRWEMKFLNRPFAAQLGVGMRRFVLLGPERQLAALIDFDPLFSGGKLIGYTTAFKRKETNVSAHAEVGLTKFSVDFLRQEKVSIVTLGLSPLAAIQPSGFPESNFWRGAFQRAYDSKFINRRKFNVKGQAAFKRRFHGIEVPTYIAFRSGTAMEMLGLLRLAKAI